MYTQGMARFLGIDCGATNLRFGLVDESGKLLSIKRLSSPLKHQPETLPQIIKDQSREIGEIDGIGLGIPGPLDLEKGLVLPSANLGNITPINIKAKFESLFNTTIYLGRDTNVALLGEVWQGAGLGCKEVVMLTLGSGVGGAIMVNGELDEGMSGKAGEIGHIYLEVRNEKWEVGELPKCGLGHEGCFEALVNSAANLEELSIYLGYGLASIVDIFNPEKIIIGGGKLWLGDFLPKAIEVMKDTGMKPAVDDVRVEYAKLKDVSGVYGAARLAILKSGSSV